VIPGKQYTPELLLSIAWRRKWLIIPPALAIAITAGAVIYRLPNVYRAESVILIVPQRVPDSYVHSTITAGIDDRLQSISQQILSRTRLEKIIDEFDLYADHRKTALKEDILDEVRANVGLDIIRGNAFTVSFTSDNPETAMRVTNRLASLFIDENLRDREVLADGTSQFLDSQLEEARRQLIDNEKKLEEYRRSHFGQLPTQLEANLEALHNSEMQLQSLGDSINRDRDRRLVLERSLADANLLDVNAPPSRPAQTSSSGDDPAGMTATEQLAGAETELQAMLLRLKPEHPDVVRMKRTIAELQKRAGAEAPAPSTLPSVSLTELLRRNRVEEVQAEIENIDRQLASKLADEKQLRATLAEYQKRIEGIPTRESELTALMRDYDTIQDSYRSLLSKKADSRIAANLERRQIGEQFKILDQARLPQKPYTPNRQKLYAESAAGGLGIGLALAALVEYLDCTMRSEEDVRAAVNLLVLATVPLMPSPRLARRRRNIVALSISIGVAMIGIGAAVAWRLLR
jgi:polysaccharide chain length determinant protein (PEP-CTERM system associated)